MSNAVTSPFPAIVVPFNKVIKGGMLHEFYFKHHNPQVAVSKRSGLILEHQTEEVGFRIIFKIKQK